MDCKCPLKTHVEPLVSLEGQKSRWCLAEGVCVTGGVTLHRTLRTLAFF